MAQAFDRHDFLDLRADQLEQAPRPGVEQQWLFVHQQVLVEGEAARHQVRKGDADAPGVGRDRVDGGSGLGGHGGLLSGGMSESREVDHCGNRTTGPVTVPPGGT